MWMAVSDCKCLSREGTWCPPWWVGRRMLPQCLAAGCTLQPGEAGMATKLLVVVHCGLFDPQRSRSILGQI